MKNPKIQYTEDLGVFKRVAENRVIKRPHVEELKSSIKEKNLLPFHPIVVNEKMEVIDGQHRLIAAEELRIGIYYVVGKGLGLDDIKILNVNARRWTLDDYLHAYVQRGNEEYKRYEKFKNQYRFSHSTVIMLLKNSHKRRGAAEREFKNGTFKIESLEQAKKWASMIQDLGEFYRRYHQRGFVLASLQMFEQEDYDHEEMLSILKEVPHIIEEQPNAREYLRQFEQIFNYRKSKNRVRFF